MGPIHGLRWANRLDSDIDPSKTIYLEDEPIMETAEFKRLTMLDAEHLDESEE